MLCNTLTLTQRCATLCVTVNPKAFKSNDLAYCVKLLCKLKTYINQQLTLQKSLPLNSRGRLTRHVVHHAVNAAYLVDNARRNFA